MSNKNKYDDIFKQLVKEKIYSNLKLLNFKKENNLFYCDLPDFRQILSIQKSQWNSLGNLKFTMNVCFYNHDFFQELHNEPPPEKPKEYHGFARFRTGFLTHDEDHWYEINNSIDINQVGNELSSDMKNKIIPFLKENDSFHKLYLGVLENKLHFTSSFAVALLHIRQKEKAKAKEILDELYFEALYPKDTEMSITYPDGRIEKEFTKEKPKIELCNKIKNFASKFSIDLKEFNEQR